MPPEITRVWCRLMSTLAAPGSPGLSLQAFSTRALPARERHEAWLQRDWPSLAPAYRCKPLEAFDVASERLQLDGITIQFAEVTGQSWVRDASLIKSWTPDALVIALTVQGEARGEWGGVSARTGTGSIQFADFSKTSSHVSSASKTIAIAVPRAIAASRGLAVEALHGVATRSGAGSLLAAHLLALREAAPGIPKSSEQILARGVLDLIVLAAQSAGQASEAAAGARGLSLMARAAIERSLGSPTLGPARLCRSLAISRSTLHRLFEQEGGVQAYIRRRRLEAARVALEETGSDEPIHMIAERLGFSDAAHLSRLFRSRFGLSPSDCRAEARRARTGATSAAGMEL